MFIKLIVTRLAEDKKNDHRFLSPSNPTPEGDSNGIDLPTFPQWSQDSPKYMAFRKEGGVIEENYRHTYNAVMLSAYPSTTEAPEETPTTPSGQNNGSRGMGQSASLLLACFLTALFMRR